MTRNSIINIFSFFLSVENSGTYPVGSDLLMVDARAICAAAEMSSSDTRPKITSISRWILYLSMYALCS